MRLQYFVAAISVLLLASCSGAGTGSTPSTAALDTVQSSGSAAFYRVRLFAPFGGTVGSAASINERGWISGFGATANNATSHAAVWGDGAPKDLGTLGGPSSAVAWPNLDDSGMVAGISEKQEMNPYNEPWSCWVFFTYTSPSYHECVGFRWRNNTMIALSTLGGPDGYAAGTNNQNQIVGWAENTTQDSTCTNGQVLQFEPVYWDNEGRIHQLPTLQGDPDGAATATNDSGEIVGISGICDQAIGRFTAAHVVSWNHGAVRQLFTVSSVSWNTPQAINQSGAVAGFVNMPGQGDQQGQLQPIAFVWTHGNGLQQIAPLPGDVYSMAAGINDEGDVVGVSYGANFSTARAFLYHKGKAYDLNALTAAGSPYLLAANAIDDRGNVVGQALDSNTGDVLAFEASLPSNAQLRLLDVQPHAAAAPPRLSAAVRYRLLRRYGTAR